GLTSLVIADRLHISERTVREHIGNARRKLGATTRTQAVMIALRGRLIQPRNTNSKARQICQQTGKTKVTQPPPSSTRGEEACGQAGGDMHDFHLYVMNA